jgi:hypothetical protein
MRRERQHFCIVASHHERTGRSSVDLRIRRAGMRTTAEETAIRLTLLLILGQTHRAVIAGFVRDV